MIKNDFLTMQAVIAISTEIQSHSEQITIDRPQSEEKKEAGDLTILPM